MQSFNIRDLRLRTGELVRGAEAGQLALVTKHGRPVFVAVPLSDLLLESGVHVALAVKLFEEEVLSLGRAAKVAGLSTEEMISVLDRAGVEAVRYPPEDLDGETALLA